MAKFDVLVRRLDAVETHPNADRLDLAVVGGYRAVIGRNQFRAGDLIAYLPEASVLPTGFIEELGLVGKLAGPNCDRIHAVKLRGALSQGVVIAARPGWQEGQSVMAELGVEKYEPEIPPDLLGVVYALEREEGMSFDVENIKMYPDLFEPGEPVVFTEKVHGVLLAVGACPAANARYDSGHYQGQAWVSSKGLLSQRMAFDHRSDDVNVYLRAGAIYGLYKPVIALAERTGEIVFVLGEMFGQGIQDLGYGCTTQNPGFRVFAVRVGDRFLDDAELDQVLMEMVLMRAPVLYRGPFSSAVLSEYTDGRESVSGEARHLREGVVVVPQREREDPRIGRVAAKSVSGAYLLRKGGTEYS